MIGTAANIPCRPRRTATGTPDVAEAYIGDQYRYLLTTAKSELKRIDPYVREATSSVGNAVVHDRSFDWVKVLFEERASGREMIQRNLILMITLLLSLPFSRGSSPAASGLIGSPAPYFRVQSGDDKELTLDMIKGKVIAIFYETKDIVENNQRLKDELNKLYYEQTGIVKDVLVRLPIIDCSDAFWPFLGTWKRRLREYSKKEGVTIYCDWEGKMSSDYKMNSDVSNVVIIDKSGRIRFFTSGEVKPEEINGVKELLIILAGE